MATASVDSQPGSPTGAAGGGAAIAAGPDSTANGGAASALRSARGPASRWNDMRLRGKGGVLVAVPVVIFALAAGLFLWTLHSDSRAEGWVGHSEDVQRQISTVDDLAAARDNTDLEYLLDRSATAGAAAASAESSLGQATAALVAMVRDNAAQEARAQAVERAINGAPGLAALPQDPAAVHAWLGRAAASTSNLRSAVRDMTAAEAVLLDHRRASAQHWRSFAVYLVATLFVLAVLGGAISVVLFSRGITRRVDALGNELGALDGVPVTAPPDGSADEIGGLARRLRTTVRALAAREAELRQARAFLDNVLTASPVMVLRGLPGAGVSYVSPNCARVLGISPDAAANDQLWIDAISPAERARFASAAAQLFAPAAPAVVQLDVVVQFDERRRNFSCLLARESTETAPNERGVLVFMLDETARRSAEQAVAERQRELSAMTAASPDIISVFDADLRVSFVSEATTGLTGYRVKDRIGRPAGESVHPDDRQEFIDAIRAVIAGASEDFTVRVRAKTRHDDGYVTLEGHGRPLLGDDGSPIAAVAIFRDITGQIALEAELVKARDAAHAASSAKSEFLSRMSHELRTPLNVVLGFAQLLQLEPLGAEPRSWVEQVLRAGRHLLDLINEVLDIARIESGALGLSPEAVSVRDAVGETVEQLQPIAAGNNVRLDYLVEGTDVFVRADRQRLKQVMLNLVANAVKYNRIGGSVMITARRAEENRIDIAVNDTGIGIAAEHLERLFVPFDRLGAEQSAIEGTGVGLPLALRLVQAMDGDVSVASAPGEGSTFTVTLPAAVAPSDGDDHQPPPSLDLTGDGEIAPRGTMLYIEDNVANVDLMQRIVRRRPGVEMIHAPTGRAGLDIARGSDVDVILLDLHLPDMGGMEVLGKLRTEPTTAHLPIFVVSADASAGQVARLRAAGAAGYLTKPLDVQGVLTVLDGVISGRDDVLDSHAFVNEGD